MSLGYSIDAIIELKYTENNIKKILESAKKIGFKLITPLEGDPEKGLELDLEAALKVILNKTNAKELSIITLKVGDSFFDLHFMDRININLMFYNFKYPFYRTYKVDFGELSEDLDVHKYVRIMLDLVADYKILKLQVDKD